MSEYPTDWPEPGPIDLSVHDLPHRSSATEWWYVNAHAHTADGREVSLFAAFFRIVTGRDPGTGEPIYAHSLTWALSLPASGTFLSESRVDPNAPRLGLDKLDRGEGSRDPRLRRAMREVLDKGVVPHPDRVFAGPVAVNTRALELDYAGARFLKRDDGSYALSLYHDIHKAGCELVFTPGKAPVRHGDDGVVKGTHGEDMFYYFIPRCAVSGQIVLDGHHLDVDRGEGWYDHEFGGPKEGEEQTGGSPTDVGWNWLAVQLDDGSELSAYELVDLEDMSMLGQRALVIDADGGRHDYPNIRLEPSKSWRSTRTFNEYPTHWTLSVPDARIELEIEAAFDDQELVTVISKPAFWEGRLNDTGTRDGRAVAGRGYVERSGFSNIDDLDSFFSAVGVRVRASIRDILPLDPSFDQVRDLIASEEREYLMDGVDLDQTSRTLFAPIREITDRGGKSWRSYAALACCDVVGGDSREYVHWLAMPEFMHVGSLIVDDVQDKSTWRRGGPPSHAIYGEALAINAGTACYFLGQKLLTGKNLTAHQKLRLYDFYFEALRAGHGGQAYDIEGSADAMPYAVETGDSDMLERRVLAIHRLKTAAPAASLARMGALAGGGTDAQIEGVGAFFEALGLAFQIIDDVLNLRGFKGGLKNAGEDITHGKITIPVAKAMSRLDRAERAKLWETVQSKPTDLKVVEQVIGTLEDCGALDACVEQARSLVEDAWQAFTPLAEDSLPKLMLRAFGWYVLDRHY